ncbi:ATP-dependent DNA ligase [Streptomyces tsukubensis]|uniref:ATP-dependent DNA ligase n=1 Tax=Streptomyces tsukubensis TaxID=83656 RepID=UPI0036AB1EC0
MNTPHRLLPPALRPPLRPALAVSVSSLPRGADLAYEPKFDGHRMLVFRDSGPGGAPEVLLQARSGRIVTAAFPDLAAAARRLPPGTVLDGEVVVWRDGRTDFAAVQKRAMATAQHAPELARSLPASYAAFDLIAEAGTDLRARAYRYRRERLVALLEPLGPPLQAVPMTLDAEEAAAWYEALPAIGVEGLVAKHLGRTYRSGARTWQKLRHTTLRDAAVTGHTGPATGPRALVVVLRGGDGTPVVSAPLSPALRAQAAAALPPGAAGPEGRATAAGLGEIGYRPLEPGLVAEVEVRTTRHATVTVVRLRLPQDTDTDTATVAGTDGEG